MQNRYVQGVGNAKKSSLSSVGGVQLRNGIAQYIVIITRVCTCVCMNQDV